jgi:hypothetical protein
VTFSANRETKRIEVQSYMASLRDFKNLGLREVSCIDRKGALSAKESNVKLSLDVCLNEGKGLLSYLMMDGSSP